MTGVNLPRQPIHVALALSLLIHAAALWKMPLSRPEPPELQTPLSGPLVVQLAPPPAPPRAPAPARPRLEPRVPPPTPPARPPERPRPPVIARSDPIPAAPPVPRPSPAPAAPAPPPTPDLAAYIESRRRARGEDAPAVAPAPPAAPTEDAAARADRIAAANLGLNRKPTFGPQRRSGGVFDLTYTSYDYAEFLFYGWNRDINRNTSHKIEVRKGSHPDIRIAVIRRMIAIIREYESGDFTWQSLRLGRDVTLSARPRDQSGLEDFLYQEFFGPEAPARRRN